MRAKVAALLGALTIAACGENRPVAPEIPGGSAPFSPKIRVQRVSKVDLLLVVDNSPGMAEAQQRLARELPTLVASLTDSTPDPDTGRPQPIRDVHVGVISSSLGSHGTSVCDPGLHGAHMDDAGHLRTCSTTAPSVVTWTFGGDANAAATAASCNAQLGGDGCEYEATWESLYHFLIDPKPYASAKVDCAFKVDGDACGSKKIEMTGVDELVLKERADFLRQDSLLAVIILSNENDASLKPAGLNWLPYAYERADMQRGWTGCANVPDDFEPESGAEYATLRSMYGCDSCFVNGSDANCTKKWPDPAPNLDVDAPLLRAFEQTRRFGYNFLWGRQRYVNAFKSAQVLASDGSLGPNPIYVGGIRTSDLVIVSGIVGVPRTLVGDEVGNPKTLTEADWQKVIGPVEKRDPHMIESIAPRAGVPKFTGDRSVDVVNGDRDVALGDDLQYACIAPRSTPSGTCTADDPLCEDGKRAYFAAYPGLRHLRILHDLGGSGLVASICNDSYAPAIAAIAKKIHDAASNECVRSEVMLRPDGTADCLLIESMPDASSSCEALAADGGLCTPGSAACRAGTSYAVASPAVAAGRITLSITVTNSAGIATSELVTATEENGNVIARGSDGKKHLVCEARQLRGDEAASCLHDKRFTSPAGWCYSTDPRVLSKGCDLGTVRLAGSAYPRDGVESFVFCTRGGE